MRRIAFISTMEGFDPSVPRWAGCEPLWGQTALKLAKQGWQVGVNVFKWPEKVPQIEALKRAGCDVKHRSTVRGLPRLSRRLAASLPTRWLKGFHPDLVIVTQHQFHTDPQWARRCREDGLPYILVVQAADDRAEVKTRDLKTLQANYRSAACCYFVSDHNRALAERVLQLELGHARIARNPFNVPFDSAPTFPPTGSGFSLAVVGRLHPAKGQDLLAELLAREKWRQRGLDVHLYGSGELEGLLTAEIRAKGLSQLKIKGFESDVRSIWVRHHGLILPSRVEGLPLALVEAMLSERMGVVTDVGGNAELVTHGVNGFLAKEPTVAALDEALEQAWELRDDWQRMGQEAGLMARALIPPDPVEHFSSEILSHLRRGAGTDSGGTSGHEHFFQVR